MRRHMSRLVLLVAAFSILAFQAAPASGATTYGGKQGPPSVPTCTIQMDNLVIIGTQAESHLHQSCTQYVTQRLNVHNWQRLRWFGWETLVHWEPATAWLYDNYIEDYEYFSCVYGSGTYTYRSIGQGQFQYGGVTYTSPQVVSNEWRKTC